MSIKLSTYKSSIQKPALGLATIVPKGLGMDAGYTRRIYMFMEVSS